MRSTLATASCLCTGLFLCAVASAQTRTTSRDSLKESTVSVYQTYQPELRPVYKPLLTPSAAEPDTTTFAQRYNVAPEAAALPYYPIPIRPLALQQDSAARGREDYLQAGGGNKGTFMLDGATSRIRTENLSSVLSVRHFQQADESISGQKFQESEAAFSLKTITGIGALDGRAEAFRNSYGDYGFNEGRTTPIDLGSRTYFGFGATAGLNVMTPKTALLNGIRPQVTFRYFNGPSSINEIMLKAEVPLIANPGNGVRIEVTPSVNFTTINLPNTTGYNNLHSLASAIIFNQPRFMFRAGVLPVYVQDKGLRVLPDLALSYQLYPQKTSVEIGWKGKVIQNRYEELAGQNPFLNTYNIAQTESREAYGEVTTNVGKSISVSVRGSYWDWTALPLFLNDYSAQSGFILERSDARAVMLQARARYAIGETLQLGAFTQLSKFFPETATRLWHTPPVRFGADAHFTPVKTLQISGLLSFADGIHARSNSGSDLKLNPIADLSGRIAYQIVPAWTVWVQGTNLFDARNERYLGYPAIGRAIALGLRVTF